MTKMNKSVQITVVIVIGVIVMGILGMIAIRSFSQTNTVTGQGISRLKVTPDLVTVYFNVETRGETSKEANDANSEITDELITDLIKKGFERKDIQTQYFNIYPDYRWVNNNRIPKRL